MNDKYSDLTVKWLREEGYTHCFFLAGGNIMHILNSVRETFICIPVVNEVAAGIAVEYFNATSVRNQGRAFALVTAGPGVTNIVTALAGAFLESRELLVVAGQVKSNDLADAGLRQRGIQEIDGMALVESVVVSRIQIKEPISRQEFVSVVSRGSTDRKGPVYIEFCLDAQATPVSVSDLLESEMQSCSSTVEQPEEPFDFDQVENLLQSSARPLLLIGGGVSRELWNRVYPKIQLLGIPIATSWNAIDRMDYEDDLYFGRPDTWGMRWSNILIQQADLIMAVGARLSLQQTGFNWRSFAPHARVVHVDLDQHELDKHHPPKELSLRLSAEVFLQCLSGSNIPSESWLEWRDFGALVKSALPLDDKQNRTRAGYISPYLFADYLSSELTDRDVLIPCSSGGASTVLMQAFRQRRGQLIVNNKALASMGYGLSGAIGAAVANPDRRTILVEGDGGFAQNLQELGTVRAQSLSLKMFIFDNNGYGSIRMTQRNYFDGEYIGCDASTGLGFPDWEKLADAFGIPYKKLDPLEPFDYDALALLTSDGPVMFVVPIDPEQTYYPKIDSRISSRGDMESSPLHEMSPQLNSEERILFLKYLDSGVKDE